MPRMGVLADSLVPISWIDTDKIEIAEADTALNAHLVRKCPHGLCRTFQHNAFQAIFVIEMHVHRRHDEIVMGVLGFGQTFSQCTLMMIEYVGEIGHAVLALVLFQSPPFQGLPHQITNGLRAILISARFHEFVKFVSQRFVERHRHTLHFVLQHNGRTSVASKGIYIQG